MAGAGDPTVQAPAKAQAGAIPIGVCPLGKASAIKVAWAEIQQLVDPGRATYYRWEKELRQKGLSGLKPKSKVLREGIGSTGFSGPTLSASPRPKRGRSLRTWCRGIP